MYGFLCYEIESNCMCNISRVTTTTTTTIPGLCKRSLGYGLDDQGSAPCRGRNFSLHYHFQTSCGAHPASHPVCTRNIFPGVKQPVCEANHSPTSNAKVKNVWSYTSVPPIHLHGMVIN